MIRINLLNDISGGGASVSGGAQAATEGTAPTDFGGFGEQTSPIDLGIKAALVILPLVFAYGYRQYLSTKAGFEHARLQQQQRETEQKLRGYDAALKDIEKFEEEKRKLDSQLAIIKTLSKERLKNVKSLDALQGIIPNSAWLDSLKMKGDKVEFEGFAVNDVVVSEFMQQLTSSIYFNHIVLTDSTEAKTSEGGVKRFKIRCNMGNI
jgi:Tfp pilus assembly protein PilN